MLNVQVTISEAERDLLSHLLANALKTKQVEIHRTEFSREYRQQLEGEEALIQSLCEKLSHPATAPA